MKQQTFKIILIFVSLLILSLTHSCKKLEENAATVFVGKWKCEGLRYYIDSGSPGVIFQMIPYLNCSLSINEKYVEYDNNGEILKLRILNNKLISNTYLEINAIEGNGQFRKLSFSIEGNELIAPFYSKGGFVSEDDWYDFTEQNYGRYAYHVFTK